MAIKENINTIKAKEEKYQTNKVSNIAYSATAYTEDIVNGNPEFSETAEQNIPIGTAEKLHLPEVVLRKGLRAQASYIFRSMINHFLGRTSYNLNKIHDYFLAFLQSITSFIGVPNGVATLDSSGRIPVSQEPEDSINLLGTWDAETNTPTLQDGVGTEGDVYLVSVEGEQNLGSGLQYFLVNDKVVYQNAVWSRIPVGELISLNGNFEENGAITLYGSDIAMSSSDTTKLDTAVNAKVPNTRTVNGKPLSADVTLRGSDIAMSSSDTTKLDTAVNAKVPNTRTVNGKPLSADVTLRGSDIEVSEGDSRKISEVVDSFEYTKEYTYIVNSQDSLDYWLSNKTKGNSSSGADFTSVLIKAGNWQYVGETVALDILGTVSIDAEANTKLTCNSLRYNTLLYNTQKHIRNLELSGTLENMCNVNNCIGKSTKLFNAGIHWSTDGKSWTAGTGISANVRAITYTNGLWVAGTSSGIYWSTDGKSWTAGTGISEAVYAVTYVNGLWNAGIYWSTDGKNWTAGTGISSTVYAMTYTNGLWIAGSNASPYIYWSTDGKSWTAGTGITGSVQAITYANGLWVTGLSTGSTRIYWSTDGKSWTAGTGISVSARAITYVNGLWSTGRFWSTDGKNWTAGTGISSTVYAMTYTNGLWIAGTIAGSARIYWSTDGKNWTKGTDITEYVYVITYNKLAELQIKDSFSVQNCIALFEDSYATPNENEDYNCAAHPEAGFNF